MSVISTFVGDGARSLLARASKLVENDPALDDLVERFSSYYVDHPIDFTKWMDGAPDVLDRAAELGLSICLCTNKARAVTEAILAGLGVRTRFRALYAGGDGPEKKPAPGPLLAIAKKLGVEPSALVMVGDGPQDVECARAAGCRVIGLPSPFSTGERPLAAKADILLQSLAEVPDVLRRWCDATARLSVLRG